MVQMSILPRDSTFTSLSFNCLFERLITFEYVSVSVFWSCSPVFLKNVLYYILNGCCFVVALWDFLDNIRRRVHDIRCLHYDNGDHC